MTEEKTIEIRNDTYEKLQRIAAKTGQSIESIIEKAVMKFGKKDEL